MLWTQATERYLDEVLDKKTVAKDEEHLNALKPYLSDLKLTEISMNKLRPFIKDRIKSGKKTSTVNRALEVVRQVVHRAYFEWEELDKLSRIKLLNEPPPRVRFISSSEAHRLVNELPGHLKPVVVFALSTGCRMSEILNLRWSCVDTKRSLAWLQHGTTKTLEARAVPLNRDALSALAACSRLNEYCFCYRGRKMIRVANGFKRAVARSNINDFTFHDLRHTWASWHVMAGTSLRDLMELGGWKTYSMVLRYAHLSAEHLTDTARNVEQQIKFDL